MTDSFQTLQHRIQYMKDTPYQQIESLLVYYKMLGPKWVKISQFLNIKADKLKTMFLAFIRLLARLVHSAQNACNENSLEKELETGIKCGIQILEEELKVDNINLGKKGGFKEKLPYLRKICSKNCINYENLLSFKYKFFNIDASSDSGPESIKVKTSSFPPQRSHSIFSNQVDTQNESSSNQSDEPFKLPKLQPFLNNLSPSPIPKNTPEVCDNKNFLYQFSQLLASHIFIKKMSHNQGIYYYRLIKQ